MPRIINLRPRKLRHKPRGGNADNGDNAGGARVQVMAWAVIVRHYCSPKTRFRLFCDAECAF